MKNAVIFIGGMILGAYAMHTHIKAKLANIIIDRDKAEEGDDE